MIDSILQLDSEILIYLNNLGSKQWDGIWFAITNQLHWSPLFALILFLIFKKFGWKNGLVTLLFLVILVAFSDQFTNLIKNSVERLRPCNTEEIKNQIRLFEYRPQGFSFYSGHASLSTTFTVFIVLLLRKHYKYIFLLVGFPLLFGYSRIYLGVHYPGDIIIGYLAGIFFGYVFYRIQKKLRITTRFSKK